MPTLVNMKLDPKDKDRRYADSVATESPLYPWGLNLTLDNDVIEKLGTGQLPDVGGEVMVYAKAKVTSASTHESTEGKNRNVQLQITDLCIEDGGGKKAEDVLYSKG